MKILFLSIFILAACSNCANPFAKDNEPQDAESELLAELHEKKLAYMGFPTGDRNGFTHRGDGILFACLKHSAGVRVTWTMAEAEPGRFIRHPDLDFPAESSSLFSKDMMVGLLWCIWKDRGLETIERVIRYLEDHDWDMCGGRDGAVDNSVWLSRCKASTNLIASIYELRFRLGGEDHQARKIPQIWNPRADGFPEHLTVLQILLRGIIMGAINDLQRDFLQAAARDHPRNALYQAVWHTFADGDQTTAASILLDESMFPSDSLPTSDNFCSDYLFQRSQGSADWSPCPEEGETYPGVDFLFAAAVALGEVLE